MGHVLGSKGLSVGAELGCHQVKGAIPGGCDELAAEGGRATDIVKLTTYVTDRSDYWPIEGEQVEIFEHYFAGEYPTNALIEVSGLAEDGLCIEIEATAVLDSG